MKPPSMTAATLAAALAASVTLVACQPDRNTTAADTRAGDTTMTEKAQGNAADAAITVSVNAALAKDAQLSALRIDVDSIDGHVVLEGSAPDSQSRQRAAQLAQAVQGVKSVDNRLAVPPTS